MKKSNTNNTVQAKSNALELQALELQKKIQEQMQILQQEQQQKKLSSSQVRLDDQGNLIDEEGNIIHLYAKPQPTTLINKKQQKEKQIQKEPPVSKKALMVGQKRKRALVFNEPGKYEEKQKRMMIEREKEEENAKKLQEAEEELKREQLETQKRKAEEAEERKIQAKIKAEKMASMMGSCHLYLGVHPHLPDDDRNLSIPSDDINAPPQIEWWDAPLLAKGSYELDFNSQQNVYNVNISKKQIHLIEHDVPIPPMYAKPEIGALPLMLTEKERKKQRTQQRLERTRLLQEKIKQGIIPPPPPKANLKNFMRVHLNDGTQDPTRLEKQIREEIHQRIQNHENRNQAKKLTKEQKKQKKLKKLKSDESKELVTAVFKTSPLTHRQNKFKVNTNASDLKITGCVINTMEEDFWMIIAEGGPKSISRFSHVVEDRVNWKLRGEEAKPSADSDDDEDEEEDSAKKSCQQVWRGSQGARNFKFFKFQTFPDTTTARNYLNDHGVAHYIDYCLNSQ